MREIVKRFRFSLYFFVAIVVPFLVIPTDKLSGWLSALMLFVFFPGMVITFVWALYRAIKDVIRHRRGEPWPEKTTIGEIRFVVGVYEFFSDEIEAVKEMSKPMRRRYFLFTFGGMLLSALGLGIIVFFCVSGFFIVIGTVVLILGIAAIELGSPDHYNGVSADASLLDNHSGITLYELYHCLKGARLSIGCPRMAKMIPNGKECIAWETAGTQVIVVYPTMQCEGYFVCNMGSYSIQEYLTESDGSPLPAEDEVEMLREVKHILEIYLGKGN